MTIHSFGAALRAGVLASLLALAAPPLAAQELLGRVELGGRGVGGVPVTLHRVTSDSSGPVGTGATAPDGTFALSVPPADSAAGFTVYFATAELHGVRYFGGPLHPGDPGTGYTVVVFDTASASRFPGAVSVSRRDVIVLPEPDGSAEVNEIVRIRNAGDRALVLGSGSSTWEFRLPEGVAAFEVGEAQIAPDAVVRSGDRVLVTATLPPGEQELFIRYRLARGSGRAEIPLAAGTDTVNLFVRQSAAGVEVDGLEAAPRPVQAEGESFLRYSGAGLGSREAVALEWDTPDVPPVDPRAAAVAVAGLVLTAGAGLALRRRERPADPRPAA
ncbi:MAG TPA: hypothetical protein VHG51_02730 [Longimicrobiaceae bacterium]|nr:hypothetical protein [Longimicrobiaceae bacterium]